VEQPNESAYRTTTYYVDGPEGRFGIRVGKASSEADEAGDQFGTDTWAYVTAANPGSRRLTAQENVDRVGELQAVVQELGLPMYAGEGVGDKGDWPPEPSLLILGASRQVALDLGKRFGQAAVVYGEKGKPAELLWVGERPPASGGA
jgi:hypothetical protein